MMTANRKPKRPDGLGARAAKLWADVVGTFDLRPDELIVLGEACRTMDTLARLDDALRGADLMVRGSQGQLRENPLLSEARQQRLALSRMLKQLDLPESDDVAEFKAQRRSRTNRANVQRRWAG